MTEHTDDAENTGQLYRMTGTGEPEPLDDARRRAAEVAAEGDNAYAPDLMALRGGASGHGRPLLITASGEPYELPGHLVTMDADGRAVCTCGAYSGQVASVAPDAVVIWTDRHMVEVIQEFADASWIVPTEGTRGQVVLAVDPAAPDGPAIVADAVTGQVIGHVADSDVAREGVEAPALPGPFRPLVAGGDLGSRLADLGSAGALPPGFRPLGTLGRDGQVYAGPVTDVQLPDCTLGTPEDPHVVDLGRVPGGPRRIGGVDVGKDGDVALTLVDALDGDFPLPDPPVIRLVIPLLTGERPAGEDRHIRIQAVAHAAECQARLEAIQTALFAAGLDTTAHAVAYVVQLLGEIAVAVPEVLAAHPEELAELAESGAVSEPAAALMADTARAAMAPPNAKVLRHPAAPRTNRAGHHDRPLYPRSGRE